MSFDLVSIAYSTPAIVGALTLHEYAHARVALALGDPTSRDEGRVTLNPLRHIDPLGFVFLIIAGFGWAKPVHFVKENLRHPVRDRVLIALAGPFTNLVLALALCVCFRLLLFVAPSAGSGAWQVAFTALLYGISINLGLFVFNMLPLPPLDGSHAVFGPMGMSPELESKLYKYGMYLLFGIILIENRLHVDILPIGKIVEAMMGFFFGLLGL